MLNLQFQLQEASQGTNTDQEKACRLTQINSFSYFAIGIYI